MLLANFNGKEHLRHRAVSLRQHGFLVAFMLDKIDVQFDELLASLAARCRAYLRPQPT